VLQYGSKKSQRVVTSVYSVEAIAMAREFDAAVMIQHDITVITRSKLPVELRTDSLAFFKTLTQASVPRERRLALDIALLKEAWQREEISRISFVRSAHNAADCCTKAGGSGAVQRIMRTGLDMAPVEQWVEHIA
jgi:hypothetical protein